MTSTEALPARARAAYERGRLLTASREALWVVPFAALAIARCSRVSLSCAAAVLLFSTLVVFRWRGGVWGRTALVSALAALPALLLPVLPICLGCGQEAIARLCAVLCPAMGLLAGALLGRWSARQGADRNRALLGGGLVIGACGALGCGVAGLAAIGGMWFGAAVATAGAVRLARA